jgi:hypothetical protein
MTCERRWVYTLVQPESKTNSFDNQSDHGLQNRKRPSQGTENPKKCKCEACPLLHAVPEVVCIEEAIELWIQVNNIDASLCSIPNNGTGKVASVVVLFSINAQAAVNTKFQSGHSVSFSLLLDSRVESSNLHNLIFSLVVSTLYLITLLIQPLQLFFERVNLTTQSLSFNLQLIGSLCNSKFLSIQSQDIRGVGGGVVPRSLGIVGCA